MVNCKDFLGDPSFIRTKLILDGTYCINLLSSIIYFFHINTSIFVQFFLFLIDIHKASIILFVNRFILSTKECFVGIFTQFFLFLAGNHNYFFIAARFLKDHFIYFIILYLVVLLFILVNFWLVFKDFNIKQLFCQPKLARKYYFYRYNFKGYTFDIVNIYLIIHYVLK